MMGIGTITDHRIDMLGIVRDAVFHFAIGMEKVLRRNDYKGGWDYMSTGEIMDRIYGEVRELNTARKVLDEKIDAETMGRVNTEEVSCAAAVVKKQAYDVANFCMMMVEQT